MPKINELVETVCPDCGLVREIKYRKRPLNKSCPSCIAKHGKWNKKHGGWGTRLWSIWAGMKARCNENPSTTGRWESYGGRGIRVCVEWRADFAVFRDWAMSNGYSDKLQIDRINNDGNYEPGNCRWVDCRTNQRNRRSSRWNVRKVEAVKLLHAHGWKACQIADLLHASETYVMQILRNEKWDDIKVPNLPQPQVN